MAPPQLPADVPVPDVGQPVLPGLFESLGQDLRAPGTCRRESFLRERRGSDEPLRLQAGLDDVVRALAAADDHLVRLGTDEVAPLFEIGHDSRTRRVAV